MSPTCERHFNTLLRLFPGITEPDFRYAMENISRLRIRLKILNQWGELADVTARINPSSYTYLRHSTAKMLGLRLCPFPPEFPDPNEEDCLMTIGARISIMSSDNETTLGEVNCSFRVLQPTQRLPIEEDMVIGANMLEKLLGLPTFYPFIAQQLLDM